MKINLGSPPNDPKRQMEWVMAALFQIQRVLQTEDFRNVTDSFETTGTLTEDRTFDAGTASTTEVRNVVATLINDFRKRGSKGI
jgi:hypothetical protein